MLAGSHATITINVTVHREGTLLRPTLLSIESQVERFAEAYPDESVEINIGLDNPDSLSKKMASDYARRSSLKVRVVENDFKDPSHNRNHLFSMSSGTYVMFHDGDDLFSEDFLVTAYAQAMKMGKPCVVAPAYVIPFDELKVHYIQKCHSTRSPHFVKPSFFSSNSYTSEHLAHREIYEAVGYEDNAQPYGYEDWHWNSEVIAKGYDFVIADGTLFFYRLKSSTESVRLQASSKNAIIRRSSLFEPDRYVKLRHVPLSSYERLLPSRFEECIVAPTPEEPIVVDVPKLHFTTKVMSGVKNISQGALGVDSRSYKFYSNQYRSIQQLLSPMTEWTRSTNNVTQFVKYQRESFGGLIVPKSKNDPAPPVKKETKLHKDAVDSTQFNLQRLRNLGILDQQLECWKKLNKIENNIIYSEESLALLEVIHNTNLFPLDEAYYRFCVDFGDRNITDIVLMPHIKIGGADNAMVYLVEELCSKGRRPLVITTELANKSPIAPRIESIDGAYLFDLGDEDLKLESQDRVLFLSRIIQHWNFKTLTIMNSMDGYRLLNQYGPMVVEYTKVKLFLFSKGRYANGMTHEYFPLRRAWPFVDKIITDSFTFSSQLSSYYGWPRRKQLTCPLPVDPVSIKVKTSGVTKRILFMSRLSKEKQVDVLLRVAKKISSHGIHIDIYGIKDEQYCEAIQFDHYVDSNDNVTFKGAVSSYEDINTDEYDMLLMTSLYEGIPITLLDSMKANLFVVSSGVGGIREEVINGKNGYIVDEPTSVDEYVMKILQFYKNKELQNLELRESVNAISVERHSRRAFSSLIGTVYKDEGGEA